jgi:hypothetical protein
MSEPSMTDVFMFIFLCTVGGFNIHHGFFCELNGANAHQQRFSFFCELNSASAHQQRFSFFCELNGANAHQQRFFL